jgi:activator of 2-hydroxyglutaryl-CoA dehydratase/benzoyl-CoA reductase/2-hydroxyglutaryl-CoA dehydratase subunit BcrC/BadD/HgdB
MIEFTFNNPEKDKSVQEKEKIETYEKFRKFCKDTNREGKTLASSTTIRFSATKSLAARRTFLLREAYKPGNKVLATSLMVPSELAWAAGYIPQNLEMFSSLIASHSGILNLADKGSLTTPRCSFLNALIGAQKEGIVPAPDIVLSSTAYCEGVSYVLEDVANFYGVKHEHLDLPLYLNSITIDAVAESLEDVFFRAAYAQGLNKKQAVENLREVMYNSYIARIKYLEIWELRKKYKPLNLGLEPLHWHAQFLPMWGDSKFPEILTRLKNEIVEYVETTKDIHSGIPVAIYSLMPYGRTEVWEKLVEYGAFTTFEGVNYIGDYQIPDLRHYETMSPNELFFNMALNLINTPIRGGDVARKTDGVLKEMHDLGSKGMILFSQEHCQMLVPRIAEAENTATKYNIKSVSLGGDCVLGMPVGPTRLRLDTFLSNLGNKKTKLDTGVKDLITQIKDNKDIEGLRLGVDFGNGFSKFLILDKNCDIIKQGLFSSGIDYPAILKEIQSQIPAGHDFRLAVSGVGSENPNFSNIATIQTTEINALIKATKCLFADKKDFIVIDIGTQDVKVLKFDDEESGVWVNTNKSCGAGTGMVLVQILDRWQHSMPEMTFDKLDDMAMEAVRGELVNTTCGIFAVTNVVSALIQTDGPKRCEILRGVYEYIAAQAIRLLPPEDRISKEVFLTGGLARHKTLRKIFRERGFNLMEIPSKLHSQFLVAYGTALSI